MARRKQGRQKGARGKGVILYPFTIRIWHWIHAFVICLLVFTGIQLRFPDFIKWFGSFRTAVNIHNIFGFTVLSAYVLWLGFYVWKGELAKQYLPTREDFLIGMPAQSTYYFARIFFGDPPPFVPTPEAKFNALQRTTYFGIMFFIIPLQIITGVLLWNLERFRFVIALLGGVRVIDAFHIVIAYIVASFLIAHIYLATLGHTFFAHTKAMIVGYEDEEAGHTRASS
jgi:thiosulfate reductase cytochrome b subunit